MEKGTFPSQPQPNPKTQCEVQDSNPSKFIFEQAKSITTLWSGKIIDKEIPMKANKPKESIEAKGEEGPSNDDLRDDPIHVFKPVAPFPQRFLSMKQEKTNQEIMNVFKQVKVNIPLLDAIK